MRYETSEDIAIQTEDVREKELTIEDLEQMKSKDADKDGKRKIVPKDEVKLHLGRSPDYGDSLMMRMFFELQPAGSGSSRRRRSDRCNLFPDSARDEPASLFRSSR